METLFNFLMGFSAALLPALVFISYYLHQSNLEVTTQLERRLTEAAMNVNTAVRQQNQLQQKISTMERQHAELTNQKDKLQENLNGMGMHYLRDSWRALEESLNASNLELCKRKAEKLIDIVRKYGVRVDLKKQTQMINEMEDSFKMLVKKEELRAKQQISPLISANDDANSVEAQDHQGELAWMRQQLASVKEKLENARRQPAKSFPGYVYVLSDMNAFGEEIYLVGATKRLEPMDIINEIGKDSVPFSFKVHMVLYSHDAALLEQKVFAELAPYRTNRIDFHKGFFNAELEKITSAVSKLHSEMNQLRLVPSHLAESPQAAAESRRTNIIPITHRAA